MDHVAKEFGEEDKAILKVTPFMEDLAWPNCYSTTLGQQDLRG